MIDMVRQSKQWDKVKSKAHLVMPGDMCIVGKTVDNNVIIYDKYTNSTKVVQFELLEILKERNKIINAGIDVQKLSIYNSQVTDIVEDRGLYIIGKVLKNQETIAYRVFGSGAKPLDIQIERLLKSNKSYINAKIVGGEFKIEQQ